MRQYLHPTKLFILIFLVFVPLDVASARQPKIPFENFNKISASLKNWPNVDSNYLTEFLQNPPIAYNLKDFIHNGKMEMLGIAPTAFESFVNPLCAAHVTQFFNEFNLTATGKPIPDTWALQMLDAWGGLPDGILSGHTNSLGDFPECLQIRASYIDPETSQNATFKGRYCSSYIVPNASLIPEETARQLERIKNPHLRESVGIPEFLELLTDVNGVVMLPLLGHCFPSTCSSDEIGVILSVLMSKQYILVPQVIYCATDEKEEFDKGDITMIDAPSYVYQNVHLDLNRPEITMAPQNNTDFTSKKMKNENFIASGYKGSFITNTRIVLGIIAGFCILGTTVDLIFLWNGNSTASTQRVAIKAIVAFSLYTNTIKWVNTKSGGGENFGCLHGLRFLSMSWVVLCHTFLMVIFGPHWNLVDVKKMYGYGWTMQALLNGFVSVDTFFVLSGMLASYGILKALDKSKGRLNIPLLYLHRYIRLTPTYMLLVGIMATLLPYLSDGPNWYIMEAESRNCKHHWWHNILYVSNLIKYHPEDGEPGVCFGEAWYLSNDMQFFILSPFIIYPLWRWKVIGLGLLGALSVASVVIPGVITGVKDLPPTALMFSDQKSYEFDVYHPPWTRIGPYLVGIFLGYIVYLQSKKTQKPKGQRIPRWLVLLGWTVATGTALAIVLGVGNYMDPHKEKTDAMRVAGIIYSGLHRFVWGIVISWIVYACINGHGGWINDFLSWKPFIPLGRLTFCVYISSLHIQLLFHLTTMHAWHYTPYIYVNMFFAHLTMAMMVGYILTITMESPFIQLEKLIFQQDRPRRPPTPKAEPPSTTNPLPPDDLPDKQDKNL